MNERPKGADQPGLTPADIYYVFFRHKWKIIICALLGIVGATVLYFRPADYASEAKLFIRYVQDKKSPPPASGGPDQGIRTVDMRGEGIIASELEILTSFDVATNVAATFGPAKILAKAGGGTDLVAAADLIRHNLTVDVPRSSSIIRITFKHPDSGIVQPVLGLIIDKYLTNHVAIHGAPGMFEDFFSSHSDSLYTRVRDTERQLRNAKTEAGVISIEDTEKSLGEATAKVQQELLDAEAEFAERSKALEVLQKLIPLGPDFRTNMVAATNVNGVTNLAQASLPVPVPPKKLSEYRSLCKQLDDLNLRQQTLLATFTKENKMVKAVTEQIEEKEKKKEQLEEDFPGLLGMNVVAEVRSAAAATDPLWNRKLDVFAEEAKVAALLAKIDILTNQLSGLRINASNTVANAGNITDLERKLKLEEQQYLYYQGNKDQAAADRELANVANISRAQNPSPPYPDTSKRLKAVAMVLFGFIGGGLALAFLTEFYLDPSCRRPLELESRLGVPLFLSIPRTKLNGASQLTGKTAGLLAEGSGTQTSDGAPMNGTHQPQVDLAPWDPRHLLQPYYEALRDRLIAFFDARNLTHKPKLVAVTSCGEGAGVTTIAAGLAASLSETGDGLVLLVDMNEEHGMTHKFYKGDLSCALDDALELEKRDDAMVADNLYVVSESGRGDKLPRALPKRFKSLVPKLRASDYDYIIFDMPPVNQISVTPRLARFMDMVLMVVESERTDRDLVKRATTLMSESKANVGIVLNKGRNYVPKRLVQDL